MPLGRLHSSARMAGPVHALLFAASNMATHREVPYFLGDLALFGGNRLIWIYDLHLLSAHLDDADWQAFVFLHSEEG